MDQAHTNPSPNDLALLAGTVSGPDTDALAETKTLARPSATAESEGVGAGNHLLVHREIIQRQTLVASRIAEYTDY
jgi:hypothetical protein